MHQEPLPAVHKLRLERYRVTYVGHMSRELARIQRRSGVKRQSRKRHSHSLRVNVAEPIRETELPEVLPQLPIRLDVQPKADELKEIFADKIPTPPVTLAEGRSDDSDATQHYDNQEEVIIQIDSERGSTPAQSVQDDPMKMPRRRSEDLRTSTLPLAPSAPTKRAVAHHHPAERRAASKRRPTPSPTALRTAEHAEDHTLASVTP